MLPFDQHELPTMRRKSAIGSNKPLSARLPDYFRRMLDYHQMDFDFTFSQMITILSLNPQSVYIIFFYFYSIYAF